jgi:6,7-dimethyl-8-ribityllumazine synthase
VNAVGERFVGRFRRPGGRFAIVVARFNEVITDRLLAGACDAFERHGIDSDSVDIAYVPGSFEIPLVARRLAESRRYAAIVCLGAVIRGETAHFEHVAGQAAAGVARTSYESGLPVIFGVLTTNTVEQALDRAGIKSGNTGYRAALDAIEMVDLLAQIEAGVQAAP